jgi:hypothetical protein
VRRQKRRRKLKAIDEQAAEVIGRVINGPHDLVAALSAEPIRRGSKQGIRNFLIVG